MATRNNTTENPTEEKGPKKKPAMIKVKNTTVQKIELYVGSSLIVFAPGEVIELPKDLQIPDRIGLIII